MVVILPADNQERMSGATLDSLHDVCKFILRTSAIDLIPPPNKLFNIIYIVSIISIRHHDLAQIFFQKSATSSTFHQLTNAKFDD